ncbi:MAG: hypothetical protein IT343_15215, partial [Candidatus Melainabacteria bacterium]|nr:hypothetical protein [Candidatus Melainabacteria bacterium]
NNNNNNNNMAERKLPMLKRLLWLFERQRPNSTEFPAPDSLSRDPLAREETPFGFEQRNDLPEATDGLPDETAEMDDEEDESQEEPATVFFAADEENETLWWFGVTELLTARKTRDLFGVSAPLKHSTPHFGDDVRKLVNELLERPGVLHVWVGSYELIVEVAPTFGLRMSGNDQTEFAEMIGEAIYGEEDYMTDLLDQVSISAQLSIPQRNVNV